SGGRDDETAADDEVVTIQDDRLSGGDGPLGIDKGHAGAGLRQRLHSDGSTLMGRAYAGDGLHGRPGLLDGNPVHALGDQGPFVLLLLVADDDAVGRRIQRDDVERPSGGDAEPAPLTHGVGPETRMTPDDPACRVDDVARTARIPRLPPHEFPVVPVRYVAVVLDVRYVGVLPQVPLVARAVSGVLFHV